LFVAYFTRTPLTSGHRMKQRKFIAGLVGEAAWPVVAGAQQTMRRVGILLPAAAADGILFIGGFDRAHGAC